MSSAGRDAKRPDGSFALEPGRRLGRYRLCARIAGGGMGAVYLARVDGPVGFDKLLALKIIHSHLAEDDEFVRMFLDEARIASRITHPNVCSVFDFGVESGTYFIAMEYLVGETVAHIVKTVAKNAVQAPPDATLAGTWCAIAAQAAEGLHAAHELSGPDGAPLGVVHRDVSPSNLFVGYDGHVQVMDFGIARAAGRLHVTQAGAIKGKLAYMAPEQLKRLEPDRRVDVWALGVVLWEMLTRQRLFRRDSEMDTMAAVATEPIEPPSTLVPGLTERVDEIVLRALARDRDERYPTARAFARDLNRAVATLPEPIGVSDLADWMEAMFVDQRAERLALVERARRMGEEALPETATRESEEASSSVRMHEVHDLPTQVTPSREPQTESGQRVAVAARPEAATPAPRAPASAPRPAAVAVRPSEAPADPPESFPDTATEAEKAPLGAQARSLEPYRDGPSTVADGLLSPKRRRVVYAAAAGALLLGVVVALATSGDDEPDAEPNEEVSVAAEPVASGEGSEAATGAASRTEQERSTAPGESAAERPVVAAREERGEPSEAPEAPAAQRAQPERSVRADGTTTRAAPPSMRTTATPMGSIAPAQSAAAEEPAQRRETRAAAHPTAPAATGIAVVIATGGWADVYVGGRRLGRTPARVTLPAGRHVLELRPGGDGTPVRRTVAVPPNGETRIAVPLGR